ncbi:hypothetical protein [Nocardia otitidiscaviarum]|uniref:hypothetical protein n=1 Tax=Nocardia otitidiscaviarum TaxID=1823 RepID=UPI0004A758A5|nr:hypothetical protein [Nocardia otitidiscaviarum]
MFSAGETVTVIRPAARDRVGDRVGTPTEHTITGCAVNQTQSQAATSSQNTASDGERRAAVITFIELMCPPRADIRAGDTVRLANGVVYQVDGEPWTPHSPFTGWEPGCVVRLRGVTDAA